MKRAVWLLILGLLFALTGCGKEEPLQEAFSPQQVVLYARWSEGEYCVVSRSADGGAVQVDRYDAELSPLESVTAGSWQELQGNLPPDFCAADRERGVVVTGAEEVALDETMGERFAFGEGNLLYSSPQKDALYWRSAEGMQQFAMEGIVDLAYLGDGRAWVKLLDEDHRNTSVIFDLKNGEALAQQQGSHTLERWGEKVVLRPSLVDGDVSQPLWAYDFASGEWQQIELASDLQKNNLRFSAGARYAVAGDDAGVWVYDTADFAAVGKLTRESYDLYENGSFHTVSNDGTRVLYKEAGGQVEIAAAS